MYVLVKENDGIFYYSVAFGFYNNVTSSDDYQRYLERTHNQFFYVLNREKTAIVRKCIFEWEKKYLDPMVLVVDCDDSNWVKSTEAIGCIDFLAQYPLDAVAEEISEADLSRCIALDAAYSYEESRKVQTEKDIANFLTVTGYMHDARIAHLEQDGDTLHLLFDGTWGCAVELWLSGDVAYSTKSRNPEETDPFWYGSSLFIEDGFTYLVDEEDMSAAQITDDYCWFKAKALKYRIIPTWTKQ